MRDEIEKFITGRRLGVFVMVAVFCVVPIVSAQAVPWYHENWTFRKLLTVNASRVNGTQTNFAALVDLAISNLSVHAQTDGDDILFTNETGNKLDHEIENFNATTGRITAWVRIPTLTNTTIIGLYYNNSAATNQQNRPGTWNDTFRAVYHLKEGNSTAGDFFNDSSVFGNNGTLGDANGDATSVQGKIYKAIDYTGNGDSIFTNGTSFNTGDVLTVSAWLLPKNLTSPVRQAFFSTRTQGDAGAWQVEVGGGGCGANRAIYMTGVGTFIVCSPTDSLSLNAWTHVVVVKNGTSTNDSFIYINGVLQQSPVHTAYDIIDNTALKHMGSGVGGSLNATLDEVFLQNINQTTEWIQTVFNSQENNTLFWSIGPAETRNITLSSPASTYYPNSSVAASYYVAFPTGAVQCRLELDGVNMSYPLCSNITLTYVHYNNTVASKKIRAYDFSEGAGTLIYDKATGNVNGTLLGNISWNASGRYGSGLAFNGSGGSITIGDIEDNAAFNITIAAWAAPQNCLAQSFPVIVSGNIYYELGLGDAGFGTGCQPRFVSGSSDATSPETIPNNNWSFIVGTVNITHIEIWVNGVNKSRGTHSFQNGGTRTLRIGSRDGSSLFWNGTIDEVAIWNRTLSPQEIRGLYAESAFNGTHQLKVWANDSAGNVNSSLVTFGVGKFIDLTSPVRTYYPNSSIPATYYVAYPSGAVQCKLELDGVNMSYSLCSNTTLTYVHYNGTGNLSYQQKLFALDANEGTGTTANDQSPRRVTVNLINGTTWNSTGRYKSGFRTDGTNDYVEIVDVIEGFSSFQKNTIVGWFNQRASTGTVAMITSSGNGMEVRMDGTGTNLEYAPGDATGSVAITPGRWYFFAAAYNGTHGILYVNGTHISNVSSGMGIGADGNFFLGARMNFGDPNFFFDGTIDEVVLYNRTLTAQEIQNLYAETAFNGTHTVKVWANDSVGNFSSSSVAFGAGKLIDLTSPTRTYYPNTSIPATYYVAYPSGAVQCRLELDGVNMSYPLCSNATLSHVHYPSANKTFSVDFSEGNGTIAYDKTGTLNLTLTGNQNWNLSNHFGFGNAFRYDGASYFRAVNASVLDTSPHTGGLTIALYLTPHAINESAQTFIEDLGCCSMVYSFRFFSSNGRFNFLVRNSTSASLNPIATINATENRTYFIVLTYNGTNASIYSDGVLNVSASAQNSLRSVETNGSTALTIGNSGNDLSPSYSTIDEVTIWKRALSAHEVWLLYQAHSYNGSHTIKAWANDSTGSFNSNLVTFDVGRFATVLVPVRTFYPNASVGLQYTVMYPDGAAQCKLELDGWNMSYPLCSNTTLSLAHYRVNDTMLAFDFSENTGTIIYDHSSRQKNGTLVNGTYWNATGYYGSALGFDGVNDYVLIPNGVNGTTINSTGMYVNMTYAFWLKYYRVPNAASQIPVSLSGGRQEIQLIGNAFGDANIRGAGTSLATLPQTATKNNTWYFIVFRDNDVGNISVFINGTFKSSVIERSTPVGLNYNLTLGGRYEIITGFTSPFNGTIDDFVYWNRSLSDQEILDLYNEHAFNGTHTVKVWANDTSGTFSSTGGAFAVGRFVTGRSPENVTYGNSSVSVSYTLLPLNGAGQCKLELNGVNMSYPLCSNTTLTYVHFNDSSKVLALDFSEGSGTIAYDKSQSGNNGTLTDATMWNASGRFGAGISLRQSRNISVPHSPSLNVSNISITVWINVESHDSNYRQIVRKGVGAAWFLLLNSGNNTAFSTSNAANEFDNGFPYPADGKWHFIAATFNGTNISLYFDGAFNMTYGGGVIDKGNTDNLYIGSSNGTGQFFTGSLDELAIWNRTLGAAEIADLYYEQKYRGALHTVKVWANDTSNVYNVSVLTTFSIDSCQAINTTRWVLFLNHNCTIVGMNTTVATLGVESYFAGGTTIFRHTNLSYANRTGGPFVGLGQIIFGEAVRMIRSA